MLRLIILIDQFASGRVLRPDYCQKYRLLPDNYPASRNPWCDGAPGPCRFIGQLDSWRGSSHPANSSRCILGKLACRVCVLPGATAFPLKEVLPGIPAGTRPLPCNLTNDVPGFDSPDEGVEIL